MKSGIVLVKKEKGMTSYDVIRLLKKKLNTTKIGHAGTLDPFASGLLIIGVNEGTKVLPFLETETKEYIAELIFSKSTDTYDVTGKLIKEKEAHEHDIYELNDIMASFIGEYKQTPPIYSALKVNGKPLYKYARNNKEVIIKERMQHIYELKIVHYDVKSLIFYVKCDKGTYVRSLGVDIANRLNEIGYLNNLERIKIGNYQLAMANKVNNITEDNIIDIYDLPFKHVECSDLKKVKNGNPLKLDIKDSLVLITSKKVPLAIYCYNPLDKLYYCKRGFNYENL